LEIEVQKISSAFKFLLTFEQEMVYPSYKEEVYDASILYEVPCQKGDEERQEHNHEERQAGNTGCMPNMRHQDVPNREEIKPGSTG